MSTNQCIDIAPLFNLEKSQINRALQALALSLRQWRAVAKKNGLSDSEIKRMNIVKAGVYFLVMDKMALRFFSDFLADKAYRARWCK